MPDFAQGYNHRTFVETSTELNKLKLDKKSYVVIPQKEYEQLLTKAASKQPAARKLSLDQGKKLAYKLIDKWAKEK